MTNRFSNGAKSCDSGGWWSCLLRFLLKRKIPGKVRWELIAFESPSFSSFLFQIHRVSLLTMHRIGPSIAPRQILLGYCEPTGEGFGLSSRMWAKALIGILVAQLIFNWQSELARACHCWQAQFNLYSTKPQSGFCSSRPNARPLMPGGWDVENYDMYLKKKKECISQNDKIFSWTKSERMI